MTEPTESVSFIVNGQSVAEIGKDGKLQPQSAPQVRVDQLDMSAEIGRQAWIADTVFTGQGNPERGMG